MSECAFCGHPDSRHRIVDAIEERIAAGERSQDVLHDYGWTVLQYKSVFDEVAESELAAGWDK